MKNNIKIMAHQVLGYPDFDTNDKALEVFSKNNIEYIELQIPFSDPSADGPTFVKANQQSIETGTTVEKCLSFIEESVKKYDAKFLIMTYFNIVYQYDIEKFISRASKAGVWGIIIPDASIEDSKDFFNICYKYNVNPILIATIHTNKERIEEIASYSRGFIYYVPRNGVTGTKTNFDESINTRIKEIKSISKMECAVGFGIQEKKDLDTLKGSADIAVIGSKITRIIENEGIEYLDEFLKNLRRGL